MSSLFSGGIKWERRKVPGKPKKPQGKRKGQVQKTPEEQKQFNHAMSQGSRRRQQVFASPAWSATPAVPPSRDAVPGESAAEALARAQLEDQERGRAEPMDALDIEECLDHLGLFVPMPPHHGRHALPSTPKYGRLCDRLVAESQIVEFNTIAEMLEECARLEAQADQVCAECARVHEREEKKKKNVLDCCLGFVV
jgi:hypothetical protein